MRKIHELQGQQRHPLSEYDKIYPIFLKKYDLALYWFCVYRKKMYLHGDPFDIPTDFDALMKMFIDERKYIEPKENWVVKQFLEENLIKIKGYAAHMVDTYESA